MSAIHGWKNVTADKGLFTRPPVLGAAPQNSVQPHPVRTEAVGVLAAGLAHDLNNMLGGIVATAELLQTRGVVQGQDAHDLHAIIEQASRASGLIRQILAFSRQEVLVPTQGSLTQMVEKLLPLLRALAGRQVDFQWDMAPSTMVRIDPSALERSVVNLLLNARQAVGSGGRVRLSTSRILPGMRPDAARRFMPSLTYGVISIEDDGLGVDASVSSRVFEPYFSTKKDGQGLGLSSAYGLIKQSGGYLLYDRSPLGGARFSIYLPQVGEDRAEGLSRQANVRNSVLIAEDDLLLRMSAVRGLERLGFQVRQAADGEEALRKLEEEQPSLLVSDIRLPGVDGIELTRAARILYPELPIMLVSGYADEAARRALPELNVAFLSKPYTLKTLGIRVREML